MIARAAGVDVASWSADEAAQSAVAPVRDLIDHIKQPTILPEVGVQREDFDAIADPALHDIAAPMIQHIWMLVGVLFGGVVDQVIPPQFRPLPEQAETRRA